MFVSAVIVAVSTGLLLFYFQATCERILRRQFSQEFCRAVIDANRLEFPSVQKAVEHFGSHMDLSGFAATLKCDFLLLSYLLQYANNLRQRITWEERFLILYFRVVFAMLSARRWIRINENQMVLKLTLILTYFANVVGQRVSTVQFERVATSNLWNARA
jgi:hypothetical protein